MRLDGVRVLDLTRLLPGPYATQLLADLGADVLKVEDTEAGDYARGMSPYSERGFGVLYETVNRGKESVALDLSTDAGREAFYRLVADADVVIEGFRPGVVDRLGVDYESVREHNPAVVYCSLSGYGQDGPYADRAGHDLNYVGLGGLLDMTRGNSDERPRIPGAPIADMAGGLFAAFAVVAALLSRELGNDAGSNDGSDEGIEIDDGTDGRRKDLGDPVGVSPQAVDAVTADGPRASDGASSGRYVDVAMADVVASFGQVLFAEAVAGVAPRPGATALTGGYPWYDVYETADGRYVTLAALEERFWEAFCDAVDREDLREVHGTDDPSERRALGEELARLFATRTLEEWVTALSGVDAAVGGVYRPDEVLEHPQIEARGLVDRTGPVPRIGLPARTTGSRPDLDPAPELGEHTDASLRKVGFDESGLERLREAGAVDGPDG